MDGILNIGETPPPTTKIETEDQARNWVLSLVAEMLKWRNECNVVFPDKAAKTIQYQRRAMWTFLEKQGQVTGALRTLLMCRLISERCFTELNQTALNSLAPTIVGSS